MSDTMNVSSPTPSPNPGKPGGGGKFFAKPPVWVMIMVPVLAAFIWMSGQYAQNLPAGDVRFRLDLAPMVQAPAAIQIHAAAAISAFFVGLYILLSPKGRGLHKPLGWTWVVLMFVAASSSFFIKSIIMQGAGGFGPIHALSAWVVIGLPMGIAAIRRRNISAHRKMMTGMFIGGMGIAGLFTFLPGRLMWSLFFTV